MNRIVIAGCGALGSWIAMFLANKETEFVLIDYDKVDNNNIETGTSVYTKQHLGKNKANMLALILYHKYGIKSNIEMRKVDSPIIVKDVDLVVDCFDNVEARGYTIGMITKPVVHVGVSPQLIGAIEWDTTYTLPTEMEDELHVCTHQVGRNVILSTALAASISIQRFLETGNKTNYIVNDRMELL